MTLWNSRGMNTFASRCNSMIGFCHCTIKMNDWKLCKSSKNTHSVFGPDSLTIQNEHKTRREQGEFQLNKEGRAAAHTSIFRKSTFEVLKILHPIKKKGHMLNQIPPNDTDQQQSLPTLTAGGTDARQLRRTSCPVSFLVQA